MVLIYILIRGDIIVVQNSKTKTVVIDFSKDKQRALRILADEKKNKR